MRLPSAMQHSLRERWRWDEQRYQGWDELLAELHRRAIRDGASIFVVCQLLQPGWSFGSLLQAFAAGACLGYCWGRLRSERFARGISMCVTWFAMHVLVGGSGSDPLAVLLLLCGALLASSLAAITGLLAESRLRDGPA